MYVEVVRLFVVVLATAAGYTAGGGRIDAAAAGSGPVIGAVLGALIGYVAGGVLGRLMRSVMGAVEARVGESHPGRLLAGAVGAACFGLIGALCGLPVAVALPGRWGWPVLGFLEWTGLYFGYRLGSTKYEDLLALAGLSTRPLVRASPWAEGRDAHLVDTSAILDGRLLAVVRAGFLQSALLVPRFVLDEVQAVADHHDPGRRRLGRRGLDLLDALSTQPGCELNVIDDEVAEFLEVDAKLVALARRLRAGLVTVDQPLQRIAELQGVRCLNLARLAEGLRPTHAPGEVLHLPISREGKEADQGVGFLDDGTMVVVGEAATLIGREVDVRVTGTARTPLGTMLFASLC